jgi:hypothetical protein
MAKVPKREGNRASFSRISVEESRIFSNGVGGGEEKGPCLNEIKANLTIEIEGGLLCM